MRHRYSFSEPQLAILTELLLRGRQAPGELRARASRMAAIDSLDQLRDALAGLIEQGYAQTNGPLDRRGVEIDHTFYPASEGRTLLRDEGAAAGDEPSRPRVPAERTAPPPPPPTPSDAAARTNPGLEGALEDLRRESRELRQDIDAVRDEVRQLYERFDELRRDLGG
jgi:hypothetical protein